MERPETRHELRVARRQRQRLEVLPAGAGPVAEPFQRFAQEPFGQDVVGDRLEDGLQLRTRGLQLAVFEEGATERHPQRRIGGRALDAFPGHALRVNPRRHRTCTYSRRNRGLGPAQPANDCP